MISLKDVFVQYGSRTVIKNATVDFSEGEITCIIGLNGSGKSTLMKACAGILPLASGSITLSGIPLDSMGNTGRARRIAYLPQSRPVPEIQVLTLIQHGRFPHLGFSKVLSPHDREKVEAAIELTETSPLLERRLPALSGGERQRVYLAMAVAQDAGILLLDEPSTHLDLCYQVELFDIMNKLKALGKTIIFIMQDLPQAFTYSDSICILHQGSILLHCSPQDSIKSDCLEGVFGYSLVPIDSRSESLFKYQIAR